ncbi:MAG TPA: glycosyltransferase [Azospirillaceae bacterium]|nr:glycosyltransferase [Azospirillaceae bacterium]
MPGKPALAFIWESFGPYHMDRCEAVGESLGKRYDIVGIEVAASSDVYAWARSGDGRWFRKITLFPGQTRNQVPWRQRLGALRKVCGQVGARTVFLANYERPDIFFLAASLRLAGKSPVTMQASKFDDRPRRLWREMSKTVLYSPYRAALAGSPRTRDYLRLLGIPENRIFLGVDTVSLDRIRRLADAPPAPDGVAYAERHFTVIARFVTDKNLHRVLEAYERYRRLAGDAARGLHLCGSGLLEDRLRAMVTERGIAGVRFRGFLQAEALAKTLASTVCLLLPSVYEPFGLVVNEALAMGVPAILSDVCGARDILVRTAVDGYVVEPDNAEGMAHLMLRVGHDEAEWRRLAINTARFAPLADTAFFVQGVEKVLAALAPHRADTGEPLTVRER